MIKFVTLAVFLIFSLATNAEETDKTSLNFAPLPTQKIINNIKEFLLMGDYLQEKLSIRLNYVKNNDYINILEGFKNQTIDLAYLGPLPLLVLNRQYPHIEPIIAFNNQTGNSKYRCVIAKFKKDNFYNTKTDSHQPVKVALTQPLSTCGYLMTNKLLKDKFDINLEQQQYHYTMTHSKALLSVVSGEFLLAGAKDSIAKKFESLGVEVIAQSDLLPGFSLVANKKTLSPKQIKTIRESLLAVPKNIYSQWGKLMANGMSAVSLKDYDSLNIDLDIPQYGNIKK